MGGLLAITVSITYFSVPVLVLIENSHAVSIYAVLVVKADLRSVTAGRPIETYNISVFAGVAIIQELDSLELRSNSASRRTNVRITFFFILSLAPHLPHNLFQFFIHAERFFWLFLLLYTLALLASEFVGTLELFASLIPAPSIC